MRWSKFLKILLGVALFGGVESTHQSTAVELNTLEDTTKLSTQVPIVESETLEHDAAEDETIKSTITLRPELKPKIGMSGANSNAAEGNYTADKAEEAEEAEDEAAAQPDGNQPVEPGQSGAQKNDPGKELDKPGEPKKTGDGSKQPGPKAAPAGQRNGSAPGRPGSGKAEQGRPALGGPEGLPKASDCLLKPVGNHPWLIRITPMMKLPNPPSQKVRGKRRFPDPEEDKDFVPEFWWPFKHLRRHARKRQAGIESYGDDSDFYEAEDDPRADEMPPESVHRMEKELVADGTSKMHGSLISSSAVLTTAVYESTWISNLPFPEKYMSLIGYNSEERCYQEQWGKDVAFHAQSGQFILNIGEFALISTTKPFKIAGEPFLFGNPTAQPDFQTIASTYDKLTNDAAANLTIYAYKYKTNKADDEIFKPNSFKFISWEKCMEIVGVGKISDISPRAEIGTFFCGHGIQGWPTPENGKADGDILGVDWFQGAPAIYKDKESRMIPLGHYIYRVGQTGDPHIFATFTEKFGELLEPEVPLDTEDPDSPEYSEVPTVATKKRRGGLDDKRVIPPATKNARKTSAGAPPCHNVVLGIVFLGTSTSVIRSLGSSHTNNS